MEKKDFKLGTKFRISHGDTHLDHYIWICLDVGRKSIIAVREKDVMQILRRRLGNDDDVISLDDIISESPTFEEFLVLWQNQYPLCIFVE
jgi:hypothetical protein